MGWLGLQLEKYVHRGNVSVFVGVGHTIDKQDSAGGTCEAPDGATWAFGGRLYSPGTKHRAFLEASYSQVSCDWACAYESLDDRDRHYGPGVQVGYQRIADSGFTVVGSVGIGWTLDSDVENQAELLLGAGLGYTWR